MIRPVFTSRADYGPRMTDAAYWRPYVAAICARHGLGPCDDLRAGLPGTNVVFLVAGRYVVKLYPDLFGGAASIAVERQMYALIAQTPDIPAPALIAEGDLFDRAGGWHWPYIITQVIPGVSLGETQVSAADQLALAAWLGPVLRRVHSLPLDGAGPLAPTWDAFTDFVARQRASAAANHARWGSLPAHLLAQLDAYLPDLAELIDRSAAPVPLHCDLNRDHVLGEAIGGPWRPSGIIDFGDARVGDRMYELGALHLGLFDGDGQRLRAFLDAYGRDAWPRRDFARRAMAMALLHEFDVLGDVFQQIPAANQVASLGELAELLWGAASGPA
jgi:Ser/Thr protein kinase RdoA (MazF antagonist)